MPCSELRNLVVAVCALCALAGCGDFRSKTPDETDYLECTDCSITNAVGDILITPRDNAPTVLEIETEKRIVVFLPGHDGKYYFDKMQLAYAETPEHAVSVNSAYPGEWKRPWFDPKFNITAKARAGIPITATTDFGDVEITGYVGNVYAVTKRGAISVENSGGFLYLENWDGSIKATGVAGTLRARSLNGAIVIKMTAKPTAPVDLESSNGDVELKIPPDTGFEVSAEAAGGSIRSDFEFSKSRTAEGERMNGVFGAGGPKIRLTAKNGSIRLLKS